MAHAVVCFKPMLAMKGPNEAYRMRVAQCVLLRKKIQPFWCQKFHAKNMGGHQAPIGSGARVQENLYHLLESHVLPYTWEEAEPYVHGKSSSSTHLTHVPDYLFSCFFPNKSVDV